MSKKTMLITHTDLDGIGCAILAYLAFGKENVDVEYCNYDDVDDKVRELLLKDDLGYDSIYITDVSVNSDTAEIIQKDDLDNLYLFDHHATALWLNDYDWANVRVKDKGGVKTSGTMMFYRYLSNEGRFDIYNEMNRERLKRFSEIVRDYDTWRWKEYLGKEGIVCKEMNDLFHIYGRDEFITLAMVRIVVPVFPITEFPSFSDTDRMLLDNLQKEIDIYVNIKNDQMTVIKDKFGYMCGVVFAERFASELGNRLSEMHPELDYISMIDLGNCRVSYRTVKDGIDLGGEIAHSFGGGGHKKAAGSTISGDTVLGIVAELCGWTDDREILI